MHTSRSSDTDPALVTGRLNVNDYVAARKEDIRVLERLIASSGSKSKKRAFQSLPRTERRRAASHDAKRVPRKHGLRKRAELENLQGNAKKIKTSSRPRPASQAPRIEDCATFNEKATLPPDGFGVRFADRQRDKIWLPTHIWHKKRAFMERIGDFVVPTTATQKQYRRTHRLLANRDEPGIMAWDTSFNATLTVEQDIPTPEFDNMLEKALPGVTAKIYRNGSKHWQGLFDSVGPVVLYWFQPTKFAITCHPLLFDDLWGFFANSQLALTVQDARYAVGSIDLLGSSALRVLVDTLRPCPEPYNHAVIDQVESFASIQSSDLLPSRAVFEFLACDPRLFGKRFKRHNSGTTYHSSSMRENDNSDMHQSRGMVYNREYREASYQGLVSQSQIDHRKMKPITFQPETDAKIPVTVLILDDSRVRIQLPRAWVLPVWLTIFTRKHAMIGGQRELHQLAFEYSCPFFPKDFPKFVNGSQSRITKEASQTNTTMDVSQPSQELLSSKQNLKTGRITVTSRGAPETGSEIYGIRKFEVERWLNAFSPTKLDSERSLDSPLLGIVTTGGFNLVQAKGTGVGLLEAPASQYSSKYCVLRNNKQSVYRLAEFKFLTPEEMATVA